MNDTTEQDEQPKPIPVTVDRASALFSVTDKTIRSWIQAGLPVLKAGGKGKGNGALIDLVVLIPWYLEENALDVARSRLASAQADKHEMENSLRRGELADVKDVDRVWSSMALAFRSKMLSMPTKLAAQLTNVSDAGVIATRIRAEVFAALAELATHGSDDGGSNAARADGGQPGAATAGANGKPVGRRKAKAK